jgi:glyoxylase-like metal-dependent hydrolase (beta-lactamase superfamily II)
VSLEVRQLTVGPIAENCFLVRKEGADKALLVDPGEEPERILAEIAQAGVEVEAILITHCHFDHVGAVAPLARETGAPVYCPEIDVPVLAELMSFTMPGFGPYESYEADEVVKGGEALELAGLTLDVLFTPGHSPGHVTYAVRDEEAIFSGDVLFQGSVGRVDLPGGDGPTLIQSIQRLLDSQSAETTVYPGHMGVTTLGAERATNPFLAELAR